MGGLLSQAMTNLTSARKQIQGLADLPESASAVQAASLGVIDAIAPAAGQLRTAVGGFAANATSELATVQKSSGAGAALSLLRPGLAAVHQQAVSLKQTVDGLTTTIAAGVGDVSKCSSDLARIEMGLRGQMSSLQARLTTTRTQMQAAQKRYYYLLALGVLGLPGLAAAYALYLETNTQLNDLQAKASELSSQLSRLRMMKSAAEQLGQDVQDVVTRISGLQNTVGFLGSTLGEIIADVDGGGSQEAVGIAVQAAMTEVSTLATDAS
jgi:hypothetical protein